tara:strand:- start:399 stop:884 length:486 start_codon:yes stop_codon:yes gene_type:complete
MDLRKIKKLIELLEDSELNEIEISEGEESIRLSRSLNNSTLPTSIEIQNNKKNPLGSTSQIDETIDSLAEDSSTKQQILAPMVGTFYASPDDQSNPYVEIGSKVEIGDTLCIIEAMKIFNHVEAEQAGFIIEISKNSGDPVEYGEALFVIDTSDMNSKNNN